MKKSGEVCKIDGLGRIVIPRRIRKEFNLDPGVSMEIYLQDDGFFMKRYVPVCVFCGNDDGLIEKGGRCICKNCIKEFAENQ